MMDLSGAERVDKGKCQNCSAHVTPQFRQTFGDENAVVHRCMGCDSRPRIQKGSAAGVDVDFPDPADQTERNSGSRVRAADIGVVGGDDDGV